MESAVTVIQEVGFPIGFAVLKNKYFIRGVIKMKSLENKGYLKTVRNNQFYSLSYLSLTDKGLLFVSKLKRYILND